MSKVINNGKSVSKRTKHNNGNVGVNEAAPLSESIEISASEHFVQFYETDTFLLNSLSGFIGAGLSAGDACIVVATKAHRDSLDERLQAYGIDVVAANASGQYVSLDAAEILSKFMVEGSPESGRFVEVIGSIIKRAAKGRPRVRIFGEMVALLWAGGKHAAAIRLEELWNELHKTHPFSLFCAYPMNGLGTEALAEPLSQVCTAHSRVIPAESYTALADPDDGLRAIILLQQRARLLEAEIEERKQMEEQLRVSEIRYRRLFEASKDGILMVDPDTRKITDANPVMTDVLGLMREELLGKELWEIGLFNEAENNMDFFQELHEKQTTCYENLSLRTKDGQQRSVEFVSNLYRANGHHVIQCNIRDTTHRRQAEEISLHLAAIVESSDDAIISKSLEGIILSWNKGAERIFGFSAAEAIGKPVLMLIPPDRINEEPSILARLKRGELIDHYETVRITKDGREVDVSLTVSPIKDKSGRIIGASKIARDITGRKQAEVRLREQAETIETISRVGQALSAELNLQNVAQVLADAATELIGAKFGSFFYNVIDHNGESRMQYTHSGIPYEAFAHSPIPRNTGIVSQTLLGKRTIRIADVKKDPRYGNNSPYYNVPSDYLPITSYLAVPVISRSGEVLGGLYFGHQGTGVFTERHEWLVEGLAAQAAIAVDNARLYELSQRERAKAEAASRMKDEFLATVSHELRTPLNAIIGWSHLLRKGGVDESTAARAVEVIERSAKSQAQLIEDLLDVSRVITGKFRLNIGPVDMASVVNAAIDSVQLAASSKDIRLEVTLDPIARHVSGDANRLQQVILNLLSNAIKFTPSGGRVEVRLERADSNVQIKVRDTGQGISSEFLPFIFDRFRQADGTSTRKHGGLGLGLAIVRHLVELHGGTVHADSPGEECGATFTIKLPLAVADISAKRRVRSTGSLWTNEDTNANFKPLPSLDSVQVLLVDDDRDTLNMLTVMLTECGAKVQTAASVTEALESLQYFTPDVLVSDVAMPGEDGYSLIDKVRALDAKNQKMTPAVALTAYVRVEDRARALSAGFNMFVPKPVELSELITAIANLTEPLTV